MLPILWADLLSFRHPGMVIQILSQMIIIRYFTLYAQAEIQNRLIFGTGTPGNFKFHCLREHLLLKRNRC